MIKAIKDLLKFRELLFALIIRGFKAKYKNSYLGVLWSLLNPLLNVAIFAVIFIFIIKLDIKNYPLYLLCVIFPWNFFNAALLNGVVSIVEGGHFIKNTCFPAELIPLSVAVVNFANFLIDLAILCAVLLFFGKLSSAWLYIPLLALMEFVLAGSLSMLLAGVFVFFRDLNFILNFTLRLFFYFVPVLYTIEFVPLKWRFLYQVNPLAVIVDGYAQVFFYQKPPEAHWLLIAASETMVIFLVSLFLFQRLRKVLPESL